MGKETGFGAVPQTSISQYHGGNRDILIFWYFFLKHLRFFISLLKIRNQKVRPPIVMYWLCEGFFLLIPATVNYIHPIAHLVMWVWGLQVLSWNSSTGHGSEQMAVSRSGANSLVRHGNVGLERPPGPQSPDSCSHRQPWHRKVIPQLGPDLCFALPAVIPPCFSPET